MPAHLENCYHVIGILFCFEIEYEGGETENPQRRGGKDSAFEAGRGAFL